MKVSDLGRHTQTTPGYQEDNLEKKTKAQGETFVGKGKQFKDSQDLMGGPQYRSLESLSKEDRGAYINGRVKGILSGKVWSEGRYHE